MGFATKEPEPATPAAAARPAHPLDVADFPILFQAADARSVAAQRSYRRLVAIELGSVVTGSLLGAGAAWMVASARVAGAIAAITFLVAIAARIVRERRGDDRIWFDARAVAETAKTQTWRFVLRVPPFADDATADRQLASELIAILRARPSLLLTDVGRPGDTAQISDRMRELRAMSLPDRRDLYVQHRLIDQADWYRRSAIRHERLGQRWSWGSLTSEVLAVVAALLALQLPGLGELGLLGVLGALAAAFAAWGQTGRHEDLAKAYGLAYQELLLIAGFADAVSKETDLTELVHDGEGAISREHTMWMAKRLDPSVPPERDWRDDDQTSIRPADPSSRGVVPD